MKITTNWLKEHLDTKLNENEIIDKLTDIGLEEASCIAIKQSFTRSGCFIRAAPKFPLLTLELGQPRLRFISS